MQQSLEGLIVASVSYALMRLVSYLVNVCVCFETRMGYSQLVKSKLRSGTLDIEFGSWSPQIVDLLSGKLNLPTKAEIELSCAFFSHIFPCSVPLLSLLGPPV